MKKKEESKEQCESVHRLRRVSFHLLIMAATLLLILSFMNYPVVMHGYPEGYVAILECRDSACQQCRVRTGKKYAVTFDKCTHDDNQHLTYQKIRCHVDPRTGKTRAWVGMYTQSDCKGEPLMQKEGEKCYTKLNPDSYEWPRIKYVCKLKEQELRNSAIGQDEENGFRNVDVYWLIATSMIVFVIGSSVGYLLYTKRKKMRQTECSIPLEY